MLEQQPTNTQESSIKVSPEVMKKSIAELTAEKASFEETIQGLRDYEASAKGGNPVSLDDFRRNRAKIAAFEGMLKEVTEAIKMKEAENAKTQGNEDAFDGALRRTGEMGEADRLDARRRAA